MTDDPTATEVRTTSAPTYVVLSPRDRHQLLIERLGHLEQQHFRRQLLVEEATAFDGEDAVLQHQVVLQDLERRMQFTFDKLQPPPLETEPPASELEGQPEPA